MTQIECNSSMWYFQRGPTQNTAVARGKVRTGLIIQKPQKEEKEDTRRETKLKEKIYRDKKLIFLSPRFQRSAHMQETKVMLHPQQFCSVVDDCVFLWETHFF